MTKIYKQKIHYETDHVFITNGKDFSYLSQMNVYRDSCANQFPQFLLVTMKKCPCYSLLGPHRELRRKNDNE